jgi:hypothetical protein
LTFIASLLGALDTGDVITWALAIAGAAAAIAAWILIGPMGASSALAVRFFSILAMALGITSLFASTAGGWLGMVGVIGIWLAAAGAGLEWLRGPARRRGEA